MLITSRLLGLMFDCLAGRAADIGDVSDEDWQELLVLSRAHSVQSLLAHRLLASTAHFRDSVLSELRQIERDTAERNMRHYRDFAKAIGALGGLPVIALKGMQLMPQVYDGLAARSMLDIDLLVRPSDLASAAAALQRIGYEPARPYRLRPGPEPYPSYQHLPAFRSSGGSSIELHWHIVQPGSSAIEIDELWARSGSTRIAGVDVRVLSPDDLLLHLCVHATYSHQCGISARACCDIAAVVRRFPISWSDVVARAIRWRVAAGAYLALRLAHELLDATIPAEVLARLEPTGFDESLLPAAIQDPGARDVPQSVALLRSERGMLQKLGVLRQLLFVRTDDLADQYNVARSSLLVYPLYAVRAKDLLKNYWRRVGGRQNEDKLRRRVAELDALKTMLGTEPK